MPRLAVFPSFAVLASVLTGCTEGLPLAERLASTRPLALRVDVLDEADAPARAEALPLETVRVTPLIADADGPLEPHEIEATIDPLWIACNMQPVDGLLACLRRHTPMDASALQPCPLTPLLDPQAPPTPSPCLVTAGTPAAPELTLGLDPAYLFGGDVELTMVGHEPGMNDSRECLTEVLERPDDVPRSCMLAVQRISVGPDAQLIELARQFGAMLPPGVQGPPTIPEPDLHPNIVSFRATAFDRSGDMLFSVQPMRGQVLELPVGSRLEFVTEAPEAELQTYYRRQNETEFVEQTEYYFARWFRNWGELLSPSSDDPISFNIWTLHPGTQDDSELPPNGRAVLIYVLRDRRQGVAWWWFYVDVAPE